jgi:hypothetical protein
MYIHVYACSFILKTLLIRYNPRTSLGHHIFEVCRSSIRYDSSERVVSSSQMLLPTQHTKPETNIHALGGFEPAISAIERLQTYALDRTATEMGCASIA